MIEDLPELVTLGTAIGIEEPRALARRIERRLNNRRNPVIRTVELRISAVLQHGIPRCNRSCELFNRRVDLSRKALDCVGAVSEALSHRIVEGEVRGCLLEARSIEDAPGNGRQMARHPLAAALVVAMPIAVGELEIQRHARVVAAGHSGVNRRPFVPTKIP